MTLLLRNGAIALAATALLAFSGVASAKPTKVYDALGGKQNGGDSFKSGGKILVDQVKTAPFSAVLGSVTLNLALTAPDSGSFDVVLTEVGGTGLPKKIQLIGTVADTSLTTSFGLVTVVPTTMLALKASTFYYIGIKRRAGTPSSVILGNTLSPKVLNRPSVTDGGYYYNNGGVQANTGGPYQMEVTASP